MPVSSARWRRHGSGSAGWPFGPGRTLERQYLPFVQHAVQPPLRSFASSPGIRGIPRFGRLGRNPAPFRGSKGLQGRATPTRRRATASTLVSVDVPAGAYTVIAKTYVYDDPFAENPGDKIVSCELDSGSTLIDEVEDRLDQLGADGTNDDDEVLTFIGTTVTTSSTTTIKLVCSGDGVVTDFVKLIATKVGTLH